MSKEYQYTLAMIEKHCQRICDLHPHRWNQIEQINGSVFCWTCVSKDVLQQNQQAPCPICMSFLYDWLCLPQCPSDIFYKIQKSKKIGKIAKHFAQGLICWNNRLCHIDKQIIFTRVKEHVKQLRDRKPVIYYEELLWATAMLMAFSESPFQEEMDYWIDQFVDKHILHDYEDAPLFIACWFWRVWNVIPTLHAEHTCQKPPSYAGPAIGMKPLPNNPSVSNEECPPLSQPLEEQLQQQQEYWLLVEEVDEEEEEEASSHPH